MEDARRDAPARAGTPLPGGGLGLALEEISLRYPGALTPVFADFSLALAPGERLAVHGVSGSGKSSLAALVTGQLAPDEGTVRLGGVAVSEVATAALTERVACLTQHTELFDDSLAANLRLAAPEADDGRLWAALATVELADWAEALPRGLATRVGEGGRRLSGGQARRVALARLLLRDPGLVILDEPFAGLDSALAARIAARLDAWLAGRGVLYLVHERAEQTALPGVDRWQALSLLPEKRFAPSRGIFQDRAKH